jgi:predicted RNA-binding protein (TIGR00451 family)
VASVRARDGLLSLRLAGARRLAAAHSGSAHRIRIEDEAATFVREGKNIMAKFVVDADAHLRPGDDAVVVDTGDVVAGVGRCLLSGTEMRSFRRGLAAKNTERVREE